MNLNPITRVIRNIPLPETPKADFKNNVVNGISHGHSHSTLTIETYKTLTRILEKHGNILSTDHKTALMTLVGTLTDMAMHRLKGRYAFALPTGMGKTTAITAWCSTLARENVKNIGVAISVSKVEALCELKRDLMSEGVSEDSIGLLHSYSYEPLEDGEELKEGYASEPCSDELQDKQFMLITHQRIKGNKSDLERFNTFNGKSRGLLIWDESLVVSESKGISISELKGALGYINGAYSSERYDGVKEFLGDCRKIIDEQLLKGDGLIKLPSLTQSQIDEYYKLMCRLPVGGVVVFLLEFIHENIRVSNAGGAGVLIYDVTVPEDLSEVLILDASFPIRQLMKLDSSIKDAHELPTVKAIGKPLSELKRFSNLTINFMKSGGGRTSVEEDFMKPIGQRKIVNDVLKVISSIPDDEHVLIFVYKKRKIDMKGYLRTALDKAKVDLKRIHIATWGMETSLNCWSHCQHVILAGVLQRSPVDLASAYLGQLDDLNADIDYQKNIKPLVLSESAHMVYQAASRGSCRTVDNGEALKMSLYLIHRDKSICEELAKVFPDCKYVGWKGEYSRQKEGIIAKTAKVICDYLEGLSEDVDKISTSKLKKELEADVASRTWTDAVRSAAEESSWLLEGRSLVRFNTLFS